VSSAVHAVAVAGQTVTLPVEVRQATAATALFIVRAGAVREVIGHTGLAPAALPGQRALAILVAVQYADNDLGPYDEVGLCFPVQAPGPGHPAGAYIHRLPVNGEFTCAAGREVWGFPKWVASIDLAFGRSDARVVLADGGRTILELEVAARPRAPLPPRPADLHAYSWADGVLRRTPFHSDARGVRAGVLGAHLRIGDGHAMADELRTLGMARPVASTIVRSMRASFGEAVTVERPSS
jgi:hypothetical protein